MQAQLPHNIPNEKSTLGSIMLLTDTMELRNYLSMIDIDWFYLEVNKNIFRAMNALVQKNKISDLMNLASEMNLTDYGILIELMQYEVTTAVIEQRIATLRETGIRRLAYIETNIANEDLLSKDLDETLETLTSRLKAMQSASIAKKMPSTEEIISQMIETQQNVDESGETKQRVKLGFIPFSNIAMYKKQILTIGARSGVGKTAIALKMIFNQIQEGSRVALFCTESTSEELMRRICCAESEMFYSQAMNKFQNCTAKQVRTFQETTEKLLEYKDNLFICGCDDFKNTVTGIESTIMKTKKYFDCIYIDYLQDLKPMKHLQNAKRRIIVGENGYEIKRMGQRLNCLVVLISQLSRGQQGTNYPPQMANLKESSDIENISHAIMMLHAPNQEPVSYKDVWMYSVKTRLIPSWKMIISFANGNFRGISIQEEEIYN